MANQLKMADVQAILTLHQRGWSARRIALELGIHRETVGQYLKGAQAERSSKPASAPLGSEGALDPVTDGSKPASAPPGSEGVLGGATEAKPASAPPGSEGLAGCGDSPPNPPAGGSALCGLPEAVGTSTSAAWPWREVIVQKLNQGLAAQRIYQDLTSPDHGYQGSYYSVRRLVTKLTGGCERPVRRMECPAAAEAQVDFGKGAAMRTARP